MKKNSFIEGTIIATIAIIAVKILGMLYVIPFYAIVGVQGAALYAYAYNIYSLFLEISTAGIPNAVSKLINEYNTLNKQEAKIRTFRIGRRLLSFIAIVAFIIMFIFAPQISSLIIGDLTGGNTIESVTFVIRCVSFAILIFPFLSVTRGFFQGHNIISVSSFSQVIEQLARVTVIIGGSYIALKVLHLSLTHVVGVAVFGAFIGGGCALLYVYNKLYKNKKQFSLDKEFKEKDDVSNKEIIKKIFRYAIPVVVISIAFTIYNNVDMILILRTMDFLGYSANNVEFIATGMSTWAMKISIVVTSIGLGLSSSLIPHMVESFTLNNFDDINDKFNKAIQIIFFVSLPMCVGISLLSGSIWSVFYGHNDLGTKILAISIFATLFANLYSISNYTLQSINRFKVVYVSAISGLLLNTVLDVPFMLLFNYLHLPAYFGATVASMVGLSMTVFIAMMVLRKDYKFKYGEIKDVVGKTLIPLLAMIIIVVLLKLVIPINLDNKMACVLYIAVISLIGALVYFVISYKMKLIDKIFGDDFLLKIKNKFKKSLKF